MILSKDQTQKQSPCSHPTPDWRSINHAPPSQSTALGLTGMAQTLVGGRGTKTGWCKSQGKRPRRATLRDAASLGSPRDGVHQNLCAGFVLKNGQAVLAEVFQQNQLDPEIWWGGAQLRVSLFIKSYKVTENRIWQSEAPDNCNNKLQSSWWEKK